jgi:chromosome segregation ATPase
MAEIKEEIKCPSSVPSPIVSPVVSPKLSETEPKGKFLKSQLVVLEAEIVSLRSDKALLETDKGELEASLEKLQETVRNADDTTLVLKEENKTLIIESQKHSQENVQLKKTVEELKRRQLQLNEELQQRQKNEDTAVENLQVQKNAVLQEQVRLKDFLNSHALEIGRMKRTNEEGVQDIIHNHSQQKHELESSFRQQKSSLESQIFELKETIANITMRNCSYEGTIERLESENQRLRVSQEINSRNRLTVSERQEIENIKLKSTRQQEDIQRLQHALELMTVNSHQDFRGIIGD